MLQRVEDCTTIRERRPSGYGCNGPTRSIELVIMDTPLTRRSLLGSSATLALAAVIPLSSAHSAPAKLVLPDAEWRRRLSPAAY